MLSLREYQQRPKRLADYLPWAALVTPGVVLNKDGSFQRTIRYRGPDLESASPEELISFTARVNNVLKCPSSNNLEQMSVLSNGGSGSSLVSV